MGKLWKTLDVPKIGDDFQCQNVLVTSDTIAYILLWEQVRSLEGISPTIQQIKKNNFK